MFLAHTIYIASLVGLRREEKRREEKRREEKRREEKNENIEKRVGYGILIHGGMS